MARRRIELIGSAASMTMVGISVRNGVFSNCRTTSRLATKPGCLAANARWLLQSSAELWPHNCRPHLTVDAANICRQRAASSSRKD